MTRHGRAAELAAAGQVNTSMPVSVVERVADALKGERKPIRGSRVHVYGVAYTRDVSDIRESPALAILDLLERCGAVLSYSDPYVPRLVRGGRTLRSVPESEVARYSPDCVVICVDHASCFDWLTVVNTPVPIIDTRDALRGFIQPNIIRLSGRFDTVPAVSWASIS